jgi:acyl-CoA thioesterase I
MSTWPTLWSRPGVLDCPVCLPTRIARSCQARWVLKGWGSRVAVVAIVLLAAVNVVFWGGVYKSKPAKSSFSQKATVSTLPSASTAPTPVTANPLTLPTGRTLQVSIVGDTIATGRFASGPDKRFRTLVLTALAARGPVSPDEATRTGTSDLSTAVAVPPHMDLVILELGTDDMRAESVPDFGMAYGALVATVRADSPNAALVCAGTWSATGGLYDEVIQRDCTAVKGRFVPLQALYDTPAYHGPSGVNGYYGVSDGLAPNDAGHRAIAAALLGAVGLKLS